MPTIKEIHEFLRRYFLKRESFLTTKGLLKLADRLEGSSFDDINRFLNTVNKLNGARITDERKYFRQTYNSSDNNTPKWCACLQNDPRMKEMDYRLLDVVAMPVTAADITGALIGTKSTKRYLPSIPKKDVERFKTYEVEGKDAAKEEGDQKKQEVLPNLSANVKAGKFRSRTRGAYYGFKYYEM